MNIFIFAGEKSGDLHGSNLIKALKTRMADLEITGVGGYEMRSQEIECIIPMEQFQVMGFSDVIVSLSKIWRQFNQVRHYILKTNPKAVILIDYPGFNLRLAKALRKSGYIGKIVQYVSPSVWAWGKKRTRVMEETLDLLLTIFPFESKCFTNTSLSVKYVGNPVKESISKHQYHDEWSKLFGIKDTEHLIGLFPGSRKEEIRRILPCLLKVAEMIKKENPEECFGVSCAHEEIMPVMHHMLKRNSLKLNRDIFLLPKTYVYDLMRDSRSAIAKSGSVTLELALHQCPTVVVYKLSLLNRLIAQFALRLKMPHYCIVNILCGKRIFPEIIEKGFTLKNIFRTFKQLNDEGTSRETCIEQCRQIQTILKEHDASDRAAEAIKELIS